MKSCLKMARFDLYRLAILCWVLCTGLPEGAPCLGNLYCGVLIKCIMLVIVSEDTGLGQNVLWEDWGVMIFFLIKESELKRWFSGWALASCSPRGPSFIPSIHWLLTAIWNSSSGDPTLSGLWGHQACKWCTDIDGGKTLIHIKCILKKLFIDSSPWSPSLDTDVRLRFTLCVCACVHVSMLNVWRSKEFLSSAVAVFCQADFSRLADLWAFVQFSSCHTVLGLQMRVTGWLAVCMYLFSGCRSPCWSGTSCVARVASAHRDLPCAFWVLELTVWATTASAVYDFPCGFQGWSFPFCRIGVGYKLSLREQIESEQILQNWNHIE